MVQVASVVGRTSDRLALMRIFLMVATLSVGFFYVFVFDLFHFSDFPEEYNLIIFSELKQQPSSSRATSIMDSKAGESRDDQKLKHKIHRILSHTDELHEPKFSLQQNEQLPLQLQLQQKEQRPLQFQSDSKSSEKDSPTASSQSKENIPPYVLEHCDLTGVDHWMVPEGDWRRRTPAYMILGEKKSGTTGLFKTLISHPQVVPGVRKELIFFNPKKFKHWENNVIGGRVKVAEARRALFPKLRHTFLKENPNLITGEGTPEYLLYPDVCDKAILCTAPWVKLIVIIREPVERLFSHYNFLKDPTKHNYQNISSFEEFVSVDIKQMQKAGVLPNNLSQVEEYIGTQAESEGYIKYQNRFSIGERQFMRSLYALQLEGWARALKRFRKDPATDMRVVISSEVKNNPDVTNELLEWLGVPRRVDHQPKTGMVTQYTTVSIDPTFETYLNKIIAPYNRRLYQFLGKKYDGIFDKN